jgi:hypothetical protein
MAGYRRGMLADLSDIKEAVVLEGCQRGGGGGVNNFNFLNPQRPAIGISSTMEQSQQ